MGKQTNNRKAVTIRFAQNDYNIMKKIIAHMNQIPESKVDLSKALKDMIIKIMQAQLERLKQKEQGATEDEQQSGTAEGDTGAAQQLDEADSAALADKENTDPDAR